MGGHLDGRLGLGFHGRSSISRGTVGCLRRSAFLRAWTLLCLLIACLLTPYPVSAGETFLLLQATTSTENSGLLDYILPGFAASSGIEVRVVAVGSGQAMKNARNGDGDVLLVHSVSDEREFIAAGWGVKRHPVMYNRFVLVGPNADHAAIQGLVIGVALKRVATERALFVSRGDDSGTHKKELQLWRLAGALPDPRHDAWYREIGSGMGATLNTAISMGAHTLSDQGTWISHQNKGDFRILVESEDDPQLFNQYSVILVNPERHPHIKVQEAQHFIRWLTGPQGQAAIASYRVQGQQLFFPNAHTAESP